MNDKKPYQSTFFLWWELNCIHHKAHQLISNWKNKGGMTISISHFNELVIQGTKLHLLQNNTLVHIFHHPALSGCFESDMNYKKISRCSGKINLHMILTGSKNKFKAVLNSGWVREKPVTPPRKSAGSVGIVNLLQFALEIQILIVCVAPLRALIPALIQPKTKNTDFSV